MYKLVWAECVIGIHMVRSQAFKDRAERFRFILELETHPGFLKILSCEP